MKTNQLFIKALAFSVLGSVLMSCQKDEAVPIVTIKAETVKDLAADPGVILGTAQPILTGKYTFFSFQNGTVANSDSATTKWDLAFRGTIILTNGGTSGPGMGGAIVRDALFTDIKEAPTTGFVQDSKTSFAITASSGKGWYNYNGATNIISPIAGKVIIVKTADGKYAKMEILSYYKGAPAMPDANNSVGRYYTFRFVYQANGMTKFE